METSFYLLLEKMLDWLAHTLSLIIARLFHANRKNIRFNYRLHLFAPVRHLCQLRLINCMNLAVSHKQEHKHSNSFRDLSVHPDRHTDRIGISPFCLQGRSDFGDISRSYFGDVAFGSRK